MATKTLASLVSDTSFIGPGLTGLVDVNGNPIDFNTNVDNIVLLASGVVTANGVSADQTNKRCRGLKLFIATGTFGTSESTMTVTIQGKDPVSNTYYTILTSASLTTNAFTVLSVYPGLAVTANVSANDVLPPTWRVSYQASNWGTGGSTLGIACAMIV
jgi:hypothetical protein